VPRVYLFYLSLPGKGDISTLQIRGHFYFALTAQITDGVHAKVVKKEEPQVG
jgi:hypothetical protein